MKTTRIPIKRFLAEHNIDPELKSIEMTDALWRASRIYANKKFRVIPANFENQADAIKIHGELFSHIEMLDE